MGELCNSHYLIVGTSFKKLSREFFRGFLTNELRVTSYELRVTIHCTSYELFFTCELRVIIYCTSCELILHSNYELLFIARVGIVMLIA